MEQPVKCVVWDLDNTIWDGILTEDGNVALKDGILDIIKLLDKRGILQSIASKNNYDDAMKKLKELGIDEYFLYPQINWNPKSGSIKTIRENLNIAMNTFMFVDDSEFEREEVLHSVEDIRVMDALDIFDAVNTPDFIPKFITEDTVNRRKMYMADYNRKQDEEKYEGTSEEFLKSLDMHLTISDVTEKDLQRAYELTVRTHQLNSTGYTYSYDELLEFINSDKHIFKIAQLTDKYGDYGKIGLILVENTDVLRIKLMLMSCRVMSRGVGSALLIYLGKLSEQTEKKMYAEFMTTEKNRIMYITYKLMGFDEIEDNNGAVLLEYNSEEERDYPPYFKIEIK